MKFTVTVNELAEMVATSLQVAATDVTVTLNKDTKSAEIDVKRDMSSITFAPIDTSVVPEQAEPAKAAVTKAAPSKAQQAASLVEKEPEAKKVVDADEEEEFPAFLSDGD